MIEFRPAMTDPLLAMIEWLLVTTKYLPAMTE
jgi:hypothetical protein